MKQRSITLLNSLFTLFLALFLITQTACTQKNQLGLSLSGHSGPKTSGTYPNSDDEEDEDPELDELCNILYKEELSDDDKTRIQDLMKKIEASNDGVKETIAHEVVVDSPHVTTLYNGGYLSEETKKWIHKRVRIHKKRY